MSKIEQIKEILSRIDTNSPVFEWDKERKIANLPTDYAMVKDYALRLCERINDFLDSVELFANPTIYEITENNPYCIIKISHEEREKNFIESTTDIHSSLICQGHTISFKNIYDGDDVYVIKPNRREHWTWWNANEEASHIILEILCGEADE